ncbi:hypothetical protein NEA10_09400 [Phormidium yuhuli AB48]|uniref:Glycosyltransferase RgtA/B/C/D-like domain-containing protein n=1 Tax=Phormidium yuhuli AB48 TaxID=2940671 RepID=A0ABY5AUI8_9CYAN|nr:hypothetical protein [Phormidium yuhuli]USR92907.1 hypothetical protein NEA10_09400 [Phormidium yuhuli AB48]
MVSKHVRLGIGVSRWLREVWWLVPILLSGLYVVSERTFYWTDFVVYQHRVTELVLAFQGSFELGVERILNSLNGDYNLLYGIPLLPIALVFGTSRLVYILSLIVLYGLPFLALTAYVLRYLEPTVQRKTSFYRGLMLGGLMPMTWIPSLRGFPDTVGMLCVVAASGLYLGREGWWRFPGIGGLLGLAVLFRRHFAYGGLAVGGAIALVELWLLLRSHPWTSTAKLKRQLWHYSCTMAAMALSGLAVLLLVAPGFTYRALTANHRAVYASFSVPIPESIDYFASAYGYLIWGFVIWGIWRCWRYQPLERRAGAFLLLWGGLAIAFQVFLLRYDSVHYTLHLTPVVIVGMSLLWRSLSRHSRPWLLGLLCLNLILALTPLGTQTFPGRHLFASAHPPLVRGDTQELLRLVETLHELTPNDEPVHLIAASSSLNRGLIRNAHWQKYAPESIPLSCHIPCGLDIIGLPTADSNSIYPLEPLLAAEYIVLAEPLQYHLPRPQQQVIAVPYEIFEESWAITEDFERLPDTFRLENDVRVFLYRRRRPTDWQTAVNTLIEMQSRFRDRPGLQSDWLNLSPRIPLQGQYQGSNPANFTLESLSEPLHLLYIGEFPNPQSVRLGVSPHPNPLSLAAHLLNAQGESIATAEVISESITLTSEEPAAYLLLTLTPATPMSVQLRQLTVR